MTCQTKPNLVSQKPSFPNLKLSSGQKRLTPVVRMALPSANLTPASTRQLLRILGRPATVFRKQGEPMRIERSLGNGRQDLPNLLQGGILRPRSPRLLHRLDGNVDESDFLEYGLEVLALDKVKTRLRGEFNVDLGPLFDVGALEGVVIREDLGVG